MKGSVGGITVSTHLLELGTGKEISELRPSTGYEHEILVERYIQLWPEEILVESVARNPKQVGYVPPSAQDRWEFLVSLEPDSAAISEVGPMRCETKLSNRDQLDITFLTGRVPDILKLSLPLRIT